MKSYAGRWKSHVERWLGPQLPIDSSVLVVKYENLKTDLRTELIRMMKYLEYPYTEEDLECTIKSNTNGFHRNHTKPVEHYLQKEADVVYEQIQLAEVYLKKYDISYDKHMSKIS